MSQPRAVENIYDIVDDSPVTHVYSQIPHGVRPVPSNQALPIQPRPSHTAGEQVQFSPVPNFPQPPMTSPMHAGETPRRQGDFPRSSAGRSPPPAHGGNPPPVRGGNPPPPRQIEATFVSQQRSAPVDELGQLRLSVSEKDYKLMNCERDLQNSHDEVTRLNKLLIEKKEKEFQHHEAFSRLEDELVALRDEMAHVKSTRMQAPSAALRDENVGLQREVARLRKEIADLQWRNRQLEDRASNGSFAAQAPPDRELQQQVERLRYDNGALQRESGSLRNKVEVLNVQVSTYNEDFQKERADRERAQGAIHTLREENESLTQVINLLAREHGIRLDAYGIVPRQE